jgi:single-strand DNA-binding protein
MASLNKVFLMGNLTRDPELRYTPSGTPVCEFGLAVNRTYTTNAGEQRDESCFVDVTMWGRRGVVISEYFTKGQPIFIEGRLKYDSWESTEGRRSKLTVVAENFEFLAGRGSGQGERAAGEPRERTAEEPGARGSRQARGTARGGKRSGQPEERPQPKEAEPEGQAEEGFDVSDDEIPF